MSPKMSQVIENTSHKDKEKKYKCQVCEKLFAAKYNLEVHERVHTGVRPYECFICKERFIQKSCHDSHLKKHTTTTECYTCGTTFIGQQDLDSHLIIHSHETQLNCYICSESYNSIPQLAKHFANHKLPPKCIVCDERLPDKSQLHAHLLFHAKAFKSAGCKECPSSLQDICKKYHIKRLKRNFACCDCDRSFGRKADLYIHKFMHELPFKCSFCDAKFADKFLLDEHSVIHIKRNMFQCNLCVESFDKARHLRRHLFEHYGEDKEDLDLSQDNYSCFDEIFEDTKPDIVTCHLDNDVVIKEEDPLGPFAAKLVPIECYSNEELQIKQEIEVLD